mgnify:CR=1 FL=1
MRTLNVEEISKNIKEMCIEANHFLYIIVQQLLQFQQRSHHWGKRY